MTEKEHLMRANFATHEAGHICAACSRNIPVEAEIREAVEQIGSTGARTWHYGGTNEDDLFIIYAGVATTKHFKLHGVNDDTDNPGTLKDVRDIEEIAADLFDPESAKQHARNEAETFVNGNQDIILKMAYALFSSANGELDEETTRKIYDGTISVPLPQDFLDALDQVS